MGLSDTTAASTHAGVRTGATGRDRPPARKLGPAAVTAVVVVSLGGPLALGGQLLPGLVADSAASTGFISLAGIAIFAVPLAVWLGYARHVAGAGGLSEFVRQAVGPRTAAVQAGLWLLSYGLYLVYTTAAIVYDVLPVVLPGVRPWQPLLEVAIPAALAGIMLAGRTVTVAVLAALAAGQLAVLVGLAAVSVGHGAPAGSFSPAGAPAASLVVSSAQVSLFFVCGSLPLFLGADAVTPTRTIPRAMLAGVALVGATVAAAVFPLAENPAFTHAALPGVAVADVFAGPSFGVAVGIGIAASIAGVMLVELLAISRLLHAVTARPQRTVTRALAVATTAAAPVTLLDPQRIYNDLLTPSLLLLWASQLIVFAAYPALRTGTGRRGPRILLAAGSSAFAVYGAYSALTAGGS